MDERPRNLKAMLSEAKDTSELMVDLAYAALWFGDVDMAEEVEDLERALSGLAHEMRAICVVAARSPRDADAMASVLQVVAAIERMGSAAVAIARIVSRRLGIPRALVADLAQAEEISHRVRVREGSPMAHRALGDLELPTELGLRVVAIRRERGWVTAVDGGQVVVPGDVVFLQGAAAGLDQLRALAGAPPYEPPQRPEDPALTDLDRAVEVLVEMKDVSEVAVGLAYSALVLRDAGLAAEVNHLEDRLDDMKERLELWVLRSASDRIDPAPLRGLLHLAQAAEEVGNAASQLVWPIVAHEELHPILALGLGDADEVVARMPVAAGAPADGRPLSRLQLETGTGFHPLAIRRAGRYLYRPGASTALHAGDELLAIGPPEGRALLAELCGYRLISGDDRGEDRLEPVGAAQT